MPDSEVWFAPPPVRSMTAWEVADWSNSHSACGARACQAASVCGSWSISSSDRTRVHTPAQAMSPFSWSENNNPNRTVPDVPAVPTLSRNDVAPVTRVHAPVPYRYLWPRGCTWPSPLVTASNVQPSEIATDAMIANSPAPRVA